MPGTHGRSESERREAELLAPYAVKSGDSRGRLHGEAEHDVRTVFQRDRDRVIHSRAFRRLEYKTQVFVYHEGDHYRNRLTHTIENAQIARTLARALRLNEDLAEAVALAHDLGHTPFAHAGERVLDELMREEGGFDHNRQTLRVVDLLEFRYPAFVGLNLCYETREGLLKHGCDWPHPVPVPELENQRYLEAQIADLADEIAYSNHDLDDGLSSGILQRDELESLWIWREARAIAEARWSGIDAPIDARQIITALIDLWVSDAIEASAKRLEEAGPKTADDARRCAEPLIGYSAQVEEGKRELKLFLRQHFYYHPRVKRMTDRAEKVLTDLFEIHRADLDLLPEKVRHGAGSGDPARMVADYIAGMTDRFAMATHARLASAHERH
ncbi:MAG: deoxyguanosinetriphosphate triphosphohydrolase [Myxococcota bacterium]|nr:deoxyguanosinetriphosphate triphosphohydrolase [Myxococcota bacterium]